MFRRERCQRGMTLLEIIVALSLMSAMALAVFGAFRAGLVAWVTTQQFAGEQQNARTLVDWIVRRMRMLGYGYSGGDPPVIIGKSNEVAFYADLNRDGTVDCLRYYLAGGVVYEASVTGSGCAATIGTAAGRAITAAREAKAVTFTSLTFAYYSAATDGGKELAAPLTYGDRFLVRRVDVTAQVRSANATETPFLLRSQAVVRMERR